MLEKLNFWSPGAEKKEPGKTVDSLEETIRIKQQKISEIYASDSIKPEWKKEMERRINTEIREAAERLAKLRGSTAETEFERVKAPAANNEAIEIPPATAHEAEAGMNANVIEEIDDFNDNDIRDLLERAEAVPSSYEVTPDDCTAARSRAVVLAKEKNYPASAEALIIKAYLDRKMLILNLGIEATKKLPTKALQNFIYVDTGYKVPDEEVEMYRKSVLDPAQWVAERRAAKGAASSGYVTADTEGTIVAQASTAAESTRQGLDQTGRLQ